MSANTYLPGTIQIPSMLLIDAITQTYPMKVTISVPSLTGANTYVVKQNVKLTVPYNYGMFQADGLEGTITAIDGSDFYLDIDARLFDAFVVPVDGEQPASLAPAGSRNLLFDNNTDRVGFQSLNNMGN